MCGICGFFGPGSLDDLRRMTTAMTHRGPDAEGLWSDPGVPLFLGHRRLSIIDLEGGAQPMWTADGKLGVVFNGEIYNHPELRKELSDLGHRFITDHSDTEILLHGYRQWGEALPGRLNGMWAFALVDREKGELFISRDRFGKKPLFYCHQPESFAFASELSALARHPAVPTTLDPLSVKKYFAYGFIPSPRSMYRGVNKLPGGHNLLFRFSDRSLQVKQYWDFKLEPFEQIPTNPEQEWGAEIRRLLFNAVKRRLMSDVPLGVFLSGGIDSSSVIAMAINADPNARIKTFSIGFEEASFDESKYSTVLAGIFGTEHHLNVLSLEKTKSLLPEIVARLDEPMGDSSLFPTFLLCQKAREHITVAVGGDGADELFAGYDPFRALTACRHYSRLVPRPLHRAIQLVMARLPTSHRNMSFDFRIKRTLRGIGYPRPLWNPVWLGPLSPRDLEGLFQAPVDLDELYSEALAAWNSCASDDPVDKTLVFYTKLYLQDDILVKIDRASMMNSLEVRSPYLDIELVDFVRRIPSSYKFRKGRTKYILKEALKQLLPLKILYRAKKGFGVPIGRWFRDGSLAYDGGDRSGLLDSEFVAARIREHRASGADHRAFLWNAWLLDQWAGNR